MTSRPKDISPETQALLDGLDAEIVAAATEFDSLRAQIKAGMTPAEVASLNAKFTSQIAALKAGREGNPPVTPQGRRG